MALKGDLASVDLAQVFQMLVLNQKSGILSIFSEESWKALYFSTGGVTLHYNPYTFTDRVLEHLVRTDQLNPDQVATAKDHMKRTGCDAGEALELKGCMDRDDFTKVFSFLMEEEIYDLFFWTDARFEFFEAQTEVPGKEGVVNENYMFNPDSMIMEAARRMDEWSVIRDRIPTAQEILAPLGDMDQGTMMQLEDSVLSVFELVDGKRNVERITEITGLTSFSVCKCLMELLDMGAVEVLGPQELASHAMECMAEGRTSDGINLLEKAVAAGVGGGEIHLTVGRAYESIQELERAIGHYKEYAEGLALEGQVREAIGILSNVIALVPTDLRARERLVSLAVAEGEAGGKDGLNPLEEGRKLIDIHVEMGELDRARSIVESLLELRPNDLDLIKSLVTIHSKAGDNKRIIELYDVIAGELIARKDLMGAIKYLQKILQIDKERKDISDRIRQLYLKEERSRSRRRGLIAIVVTTVVLVVLGSLYSLYEINARQAYGAIDATGCLEKKDFAGAISMFRNFQDKYPLSLMQSTAAEAIAEIEEQEAAHKATLERQLQEREAELAATLDRYDKAYLSYQRCGQESSDLQAAKRSLDLALEISGLYGAGTDLGWVRTPELQARIAKMRTQAEELKKLQGELGAYLGGADRRRTAIDTSLAGRQWRQAWLHARSLLEEYPLSPEAKTLLVPIYVATKPAGATVTAEKGALLDSHGAPLEGGATTPTILYCRPDRPQRIRITKPGYRTLQRRLALDTDSPIRISLPVEPKRVTPLTNLPLRGATGEGATLVVGMVGGRLIGTPRDGGKPLWKRRLPGLAELSAGPVAREGCFFVGTTLGGAYGFAIADGKPLWSTTLEGQAKVEPLPVPGGVLFCTDKGLVYRFDSRKGTQVWRTNVGAPIQACPVAHKGALYVPMTTGAMAIIDLESGARVQVFQAGGPLVTTPIVAGTRLLVPTQKGRVNCFDLDSGERPWTFDHKGAGKRTYMALCGGTRVVVGRDDGTLFGLDLKSGESTSTIRLQGTLITPPVWTGRHLYVGLADKAGRGMLMCLDPDTLVPVWKYRFKSRLMPPLRVVGGELLVSCGDRRVYTFP